ncbi:hypothetical protein [Nocardia sp. alder85J]|uniref:hypothetical protein n=1 Tax=Nocardia sp. alder85J TaxID=2862949 RepID=UPI001CD3B3C5|nr:hypothetical protein [Nocardia sp. alder85J]MCX4096283.1 hypothetical protein [Nocardia sp. alder85J]
MIINWGSDLVLLLVGAMAAMTVYGMIVALPSRIPRDRTAKGIQQRIAKDKDNESDA